MADYYTLLARAVAGLPQSTPETRRAIYERARNALLGQLRISDPPVDEADISRESNKLDAAIARVETELAGKLAPAPGAPRAATPAAAVVPPRQTAATPAPAAPALTVAPLPKPAQAQPPAPTDVPGAIRPTRPKAVPPAAPKASRPATGTNRMRLLGVGAVVLAVVACVAAAAIYLPNPPFDGSKPKLAEPVNPGGGTADPRPAKISDRIKRPDKTADPAPDPVPPPKPPVAPVPQNPVSPDPKATLPVAQRAAIVVQVTAEDAKNTNTYLGTVVWRSDNSNAGAGQPLQSIVRADVDIPDAKMTASILFQPNKDPAFPASHTVKVRFVPGAGSPLGAVKAIDVPEMREENTPSGTRLLGLAATISDNNFLAALAQGESIVPRNLDLIRNRAWLDVPFRLASGQYGKMVVEKGQAGDRVINEALAAWGN